MSSGEKIIEDGGEGPSHEPPQAITIHIMAPSDLGNNAIDSALVASVETQDTKQESDSSLLVVPAEDETISVSAKNIIRTVTETNVGSEDLPVISNINSDQVSEQSIELVTKDDKQVEEIVEEDIGCHCLICNEELQEENNVPVFKSFTETSQRKVSVFLGDLVGHKLTSRKTHSTIICSHCFKLLNKLDLLEFEIQETKEKIVTKYQATVAAYGGRARRKKSAAANKSDYVFPKIEPEEEEKVDLEVEGDDIYQPQVDDLLEEEQDKREDRDSMDEEWEPEIKRARIKRESSADPNGPPKRKRGRPRKDAANPKDVVYHQHCEKKQTSELSKETISSAKGMQEEKTVVKLFSDKQCPVCESGFPSTAEMKSHFKVHRLSLEFLCCKHCKSEFPPNLQFFLKHCKSCYPLEQQAKGTKWCVICQKELKKYEYVKHMASHKTHNRILLKAFSSCKGSLEEKIAPSKEVSPGKLNLDEKFSVKFSDKQCPVCESGFIGITELKYHFRGHHSSVESLSCKHCKLELPSNILHFIKHCKSCFPKEQQAKHSSWCGLCQRSLTKSEYESHMASHKVIPCPVCNEEFSRDILRGHMTTHDQNIFTCYDCHAVYNDASNLAYHRKRNHLGEEGRPHLCEVCGKKFVAPSELRIHMTTVHNNVRKFVCEFCGASFKVASALSYHRRTHTGERPHVCRECGNSFAKPSAIAKHVRLVHKMEYQGKYRKRLSKDKLNSERVYEDENLCVSNGGPSDLVDVADNHPSVKIETTDFSIEVHSLKETKD